MKQLNRTFGKVHLGRFARSVLNEQGLIGWRVKWTGFPGLCVFSKREIWIPAECKKMRPWQGMEYVLHEVAHALDGPRIVGPKSIPFKKANKMALKHDPHDYRFYIHYCGLLLEYMTPSKE